MSLLEMLKPRMVVPQKRKPAEPSVIEGAIARFGMASANDYLNHFVFRIEGRREAFAFSLRANHRIIEIGLVMPGDSIKATGRVRDGLIRDCIIEICAGSDTFSFDTDLQIIG